MTRMLFRGLLLLVFMGMVPMSCFFHCPELPDYANLRAFSLALAEPQPGTPAFNETELASGAHTSAPALLATIRRLDYDYVAAPTFSAPFTGAALAFSCVEDFGSKGLKDRVSAVTLTSTGAFNGVAAGQPLNQFVRVRTYRNYADTVAFPLAQLADSFNTWRESDLQGPLSLRISPKPTDNARQQFELRIKLESGKEVVQTTPEIFWE